MGELNDGVANFILKTYQILQNPVYGETIRWGIQGREFSIVDMGQFEQTVLPLYFRHRNIHSFIRQLNMYGFHKSRKEPAKNIFSHPHFQQAHPEWLSLVRRRPKLEQKQAQNEPRPQLPLAPPRPSQSTRILQPLDNDKTDSQPVSCCKRETARETKEELRSSPCCLPVASESHLPLKSLISRSQIMDINPQMYSNMRENVKDEWGEFRSEDDLVSIEDEIERERKVFLNRQSGVSILQTHTLLDF